MSDSGFRELMLADNPEFPEVMRCVFGVEPHETDVYLALLDYEDAVSASTLAEDMDRDRSTMSRTLDGLREKDVVSRRRELLDGGGQVYCYSAEPLPDLKDRLHAELDAWTATVHDRIDEFEQVA